MAADEQNQQAWLLGCLNAVLDPTLQFRAAAEQALSKAAHEPGYGVLLAKTILDTGLATGLRQLAGVLLKQYVKQHWDPEDEKYVPPVVSQEDKGVIRGLLPPALADPENKIRTAAAMVIASIAVVDWPEEWPSLMIHILDYLNDKSDTNKVNGAIACLAMFATDIDDQQVPHLVPVLFPALHSIISSPMAYDPSARKDALYVLHTCIATLGVISGAHKSKTKALMSPMLGAWMQQFATILSTPVRADDPEDWGLKRETFQNLLQIVQNFPKLAFSEFAVVMEPIWQSFVSGYHCLERAAQEADISNKLEGFVVQMLEFLVTLVRLPRYHQVLLKSMKDVAYFAIGYCQMTEEQVETWSADPNEFLTEEEIISISYRSSGLSLLQEIVDSYKRDGVVCILEAASRRIAESDSLKGQGENGWWKLREAAILTLGSCIDMTQPDVKSCGIEGHIGQLLVDSLSEDAKFCPFLYGRALWAATKFTDVINHEQREKVILAAVQGLSQDSNVPVIIGACQALTDLLPKVDPALCQPYLLSIFEALCSQLHQDNEDFLQVLLPAVQSVVVADKSHVLNAESVLSPLLLNIWAKYINDPLLSVEALDTLEIVKNVAGSLQPLFMRVLPSVATILQQPAVQDPVLVGGAIELLTMLIKNAPIEVMKCAHDAVFNTLIELVLRFDDSSILENGTECLAVFIRTAGENLLTWSADPNLTTKLLLDVAARLLDPQKNPSLAFSGTFIIQLIERLHAQIFPCLGDIVTGLVRRLETSVLKESLIFVFAKLVFLSAPNYGQLLELLMGIPSTSYENGLVCVMSEWTKYHGDIHGSYRIKVSTIALANLLSSGHPILSQVMVPGRLLETPGGIRTRQRARAQPDQWTKVPVPHKIFSLLADGIIEADEAANPCDSDDDWEEPSSDDEDGNEERVKNMQRLTNSPFQPAELYKQYLDSQEINGDGDDEEEDAFYNLFRDSDPVNKIHLRTYLRDFMRQLSANAPAAFAELFKELSDREKKAVQTVLTS